MDDLTKIPIEPQDMQALLAVDPIVKLKASNVTLARLISERDAEIARLKEQLATTAPTGNGVNPDPAGLQATVEATPSAP